MNCPPDGIQCTVNSQVLMVYRCGDVYRKFRNIYWKFVHNTTNTSDGYNRVRCGNSMYMRHRIIGYAYLNLDIDDLSQQIDHINGDKLCNHVDNLRIVPHEINMQNKIKCKGYSWDKRANKWQATIGLNKKKIHLGYYDTPEEARSAYLAAKLIHHPSCPIRDA